MLFTFMKMIDRILLSETEIWGQTEGEDRIVQNISGCPDTFRYTHSSYSLFGFDWFPRCQVILENYSVWDNDRLVDIKKVLKAAWQF